MSDLQIAAAKDNNKQVRQKKEEAGGKRETERDLNRCRWQDTVAK